jgi:hypothetical protein
VTGGFVHGQLVELCARRRRGDRPPAIVAKLWIFPTLRYHPVTRIATVSDEPTTVVVLLDWPLQQVMWRARPQSREIDVVA